ncbi:calcium-binding protein [Roseovarius sp.]|uniref:calcium-binding protein n=1 Tax=Roseovarius sp. TaxID=1486281 RepID=UPI003BACAE3F
MELQLRGTIATGQGVLDTGISDLEYVDGPNGPVLISVSGPEGGLATYRLREDRLPHSGDQALHTTGQVSGAGHDLLVTDTGGTVRLYATGFNNDGILRYTLGTGGDLGGRAVLRGADIGAAPAVAAITAGGDLILADPGQAGFSVHGTGGGSLGTGYTVADTAATHADAIAAAATAGVGGTDIVIVASQSEYGVTAYTIGANEARAGDSIGPAQGLGIMVPTDIAIATTAQGTYVIVASEPSNGESGALSVMRLDAQGGLTPTDHVLDTRDSRFGNVQKVATLTHDGHTYVVAAGGDGGVTLFELMPDGRLVHIDSFEGTIQAPLGDVTALELAVIGDELQVFAATEEDAGIAVLRADLSQQGTVLVAGTGNDTLTGTGRDDILLDGSGSDRLEGRGGADRYVLTPDGQTDTIVGFDPAQDILDLSGLPFLYDVARLDIVSTSYGARITYRGETIILRSANGQPLDPEAVRGAVEVAINRSFSAPAREIDGTTGADLLRGDWGPDTLIGNDGNDTLEGHDGGDLLVGGRGNDRILGMDGGDILKGGRGTDLLYGGEGADTLYGGSGNDRLLGQNGGDALFGQGDDDTVEGGNGDDTLHGDLGNDLLLGGAQNDRLNGGDGADTLRGDDGDDTLAGDAGNDRLDGGTGNDSLEGGDGDDRLFGQSGADTLRGENGNDSLRGQVGNDRLFGGAGADTLRGDSGHDTLSGDGGNDLLFGGGWNDSLLGQTGHDTLYGEAGNDTLRGGDHNDRLHGGEGHDYITGDTGNDELRGDAGSDSMYGGAGADSLYGGAGRDTLNGGDGNDSIKGGGDADLLIGGNGADYLHTQNGDDIARGGDGGDTLIGNNGEDTLFGDGGADSLKGGFNWDSLSGGDGNDTLLGQNGNDTLDGGRHDDSLRGNNGNDVLYGGGGYDILEGGYGNDWLDGGNGNDTLIGIGGADTLIGGGGDDILSGGNARDVFIFDTDTNTGHDTITDYQNGTDVIRLDGGADYDDLTIRRSGGDTVISWDNGTITLEGVTGRIDEDDFLFG